MLLDQREGEGWTRRLLYQLGFGVNSAAGSSRLAQKPKVRWISTANRSELIKIDETRRRQAQREGRQRGVGWFPGWGGGNFFIWPTAGVAGL